MAKKFAMKVFMSNCPGGLSANIRRIILLTLLFSARATQKKKNEVVKCHYTGSHQGPLGLQSINIPADLFMQARKTLPVKLLGKVLRLNQDLKSGYIYKVLLKCWHFLQLGVVAHSCDSATGELGLWIVVGWDPPDEAGHVEPVSALSLLSTWPPPGSRR